MGSQKPLAHRIIGPGRSDGLANCIGRSGVVRARLVWPQSTNDFARDALLKLLLSFVVVVIQLYAPCAYAHPGGLAADGCHNDRKHGGRHCHRGGGASSETRASADRPQRLAGRSVWYPNCTAARNAGAAPVRRGDPGYAPHLDRDRDGVGCE